MVGKEKHFDKGNRSEKLVVKTNVFVKQEPQLPSPQSTSSSSEPSIVSPKETSSSSSKLQHKTSIDDRLTIIKCENSLDDIELESANDKFDGWVIFINYHFDVVFWFILITTTADNVVKIYIED